MTRSGSRDSSRFVSILEEQRGVALLLTLILMIGIVAISAGAVIMTGTDDFTYSVPANAEKCNDIAGFVSQGSVVMAHNYLNAPKQLPGNGNAWLSFDDTESEFLDGIVLGTNPGFETENYAAQPRNAQSCLGVPNGRGCLFLTGGVIEKRTGIMGVTDGRGYIERYSYDSNARFCPPPYFPTTGRFEKKRYYQVNPEAFRDIGTFFDDLH